jgi:dimethylargininase
MFTQAIVRKPGTNFSSGLTTAHLGTPDYERMLRQHAAYIQALRTVGLEVIVLEADPKYPDGYFVEDVAIVTPNIAVIAHPGAPSRKGEEDSIEPVLAPYRSTMRIQSPGTVEGGDVLMVGTHFFIGISARTNLEGAIQLGQILEQHGNTWTGVSVAAGLHLKSSVNAIGGGTLLIVEDFAGRNEFSGYPKIIVPQSESYAANTLWINDHLLMPMGFPETRRRLAANGLPLVELDVSEAQKMDGGLTCMSLRI